MTATTPSLDPAQHADRSMSRRRLRRREYLLFLAFIAPNVILLAVFAYWPVLYNAYLSMTSWNLLSETKPWIWFANYVDMFTDPEFGAVVWHTIVFSGGIVIISIILGLAVAILLDQKLRGRNLVRTFSFAPHIVSGAAVGTIWLYIFDPSYGLLKVLLQAVGVTSPAWMTDSAWALPGLIIVYVWKTAGFIAVIYLAGLQGLPNDLYEAAKIDRAGPITTFFRITLPLLSPVTFFVVVTSIIGSFQAFDVIAVMTEGGPGTATTTLSWYVYEQAFQAFDAGHAGAGAMIMFVLLVLITAAQARFTRNRVHYQ
ncbi:carbohydrate ABC transporter permease [Microlunatus soli]|uniref:Carbohydrate ABC transporter membrane protein 1, CUT1 family n=1 Tax=Microlunatus soli TaxID=630515 RepID=A0A1H1QMT8_9ACTN|nr:sugar ABC transporter permease [Microlunatus soli]SDS24653.1 carbohydrate ABC transporter membrane protein 1, CUT1 family [Microlunatus soli]